MLRSRFRFPTIILAGALLAGACDDASVTGPDDKGIPGDGVTLLLTDAPGDLEAAVVTISHVYLQGDGGRVTLMDEPFTADLLTLQNSVATMVSGVDVPEGRYSELRLVVSGAYIEVEAAGGGTRIFASSPNYEELPAGATVDGVLHMPSFGTSGLKVRMPGGHLDVDEGATIVLIDFDVEESFGHEAGNSGKWVMHPVVTATEVTFGGNVLARLQLGQGVTLPQLNGQTITLAAFSAVLTPVGGGTPRTVVFADADGDGIFEAMFSALLPGDYTLNLLLPTGLLGTFDVTLPLTVTVSQNQTEIKTITLSTAAAAGSITATLNLQSGVTLPPVGGNATTLGQFRAQLTPPGGGTPIVVTFTDANNDGTWEAKFSNLAAGQYSLTLLTATGVTATYNPVPPVTVDLTAGANETRAFTITAAS